MRVLLTGPFGNVGLSTLEELIKRDHQIRLFDIKNKKNRKIAQKYKNQNIEMFWGDLRDIDAVKGAIEGQEIVIHLAAIIPPLADKLPELADEVNVGGTINIINAIKKHKNKAKLIFTSSIAVYGDRRSNPMIKVGDPLNPSKGDYYSISKIKAELAIRKSGIDFAIFRLTYITSVNKLKMDPLMFHMPLDTCIEICDTKDVGLALANATECNEIWGETFHIAGGEECRTTYKDYINNMMKIFGLGANFLPEEAYEEEEFHCGYMDTTKSQKLFQYQRCTLEDYYKQVRQKVGSKRYFMKMVKWAIRSNLLKQSEAYRRFKFFKRKIGTFTISEHKLIRKILHNNFQKIDYLEKKVNELEKVIHILKDKDDQIDLIEQKQLL